MAIAKITGPGLTAIAILVVLLWSCILGEHVIMRNANREASRALRDIRVLQIKKRAEPVSLPAPEWPGPERPTLG